MPKWEALRGENEDFALYLLQNTMFRCFAKRHRKGEPKVIEDAERHRRTPRPTAISGTAMRACVAGFDWGRFNASRRQILPMLACEKPKITEQAIVWGPV